jgi:FAD binding domain
MISFIWRMATTASLWKAGPGPMKHIDIDPAARIGRFGAGLTWSELDAATQEHGLAVTGWRVSHTGVAGLTLGSGSGWLERMYGMTCASLLSAEVVTADGQVLQASAEENADLFWGLRGGGGNFGVVTEFQFGLHPVGPIVFAGMILYPRAVAAELARYYRDFIQQAPEEVGGGLALITAPPEEFVPEEARGKPACGLIVIYVGDPQQGEQAFRPLLEWGDPWLTMVQPMPYVAVQQLIDPANPWGINEYAKVDYLPELPDEAIDTMMLRAAAASSPFTEVILCPLGGAGSRMHQRTMALPVPDANWMYFCMAKSWDPAEQGRVIGVDRDESALAAARDLIRQCGAPNIGLRAAEATATGLEPVAWTWRCCVTSWRTTAVVSRPLSTTWRHSSGRAGRCT